MGEASLPPSLPRIPSLPLRFRQGRGSAIKQGEGWVGIRRGPAYPAQIRSERS